ncbi:hypothetical protein TIFTF001_025897 [Ficus carica]|uniref:Uncharacterized protein n=1 Tax=Ficus carica TaxID=3494 RepID=A0AA88ARH3_FICCA|nr:hypothetical protein TIFTF001_025897 [Ficus carica]
MERPQCPIATLVVQSRLSSLKESEISVSPVTLERSIVVTRDSLAEFSPGAGGCHDDTEKLRREIEREEREGRGI